jgi:ATP-dependent DNA helicase DinG
MRRNTDRGIITVLDRRLLAKSYGRLFLASLPETRQLFSPMEDLIFEIKSFLK